MAMTFLQKMRLMFRGWNRRREERTRLRNAAFLERELGAGGAVARSTSIHQEKPPREERFDLDGLQVAWIDDSGAFVRFLDLETGDVVECEEGAEAEIERLRSRASRYREVPARSAASDAEERRLFVERLEPRMRLRLMAALAGEDGAREFRRILSTERRIERDWYNFRNDRAIAAIQEWLATHESGDS